MNKKFWIFAAICVVVAVLYVVSPIDAIPDLVMVIGWLDDLVVALLGLAGLTVNILLALGVLTTPENNGYCEQYGEYREV